MLSKRASRIGKEIIPLLNGGRNLLDFGCGDMVISSYLHNNCSKIKITGIDVVDYDDFNRTNLPFLKYDGKKIPFDDKSFDTVIAIAALHHCDSPRRMLRECTRVARRRLVLFEDIYCNKLEEIAVKTVDYLGNRLELSSVNIPFNFLSLEEWKKEFEKNNLKIKCMKRVYPLPFLPSKHYIFCLEKM